MGVERALPCPEDIRTLAATNLANEVPTMSCSTDDLLERHCVPDERHDGGIRLLALEIPIILQPFRASEQFRIDRRRTDCGTDRPHGTAYRIEESRARVLHQVPTVGDLDGTGQRLCRGLTVAAATVARYDSDLRIVSQTPRLPPPSLGRSIAWLADRRRDPTPINKQNRYAR